LCAHQVSAMNVICPHSQALLRENKLYQITIQASVDHGFLNIYFAYSVLINNLDLVFAGRDYKSF
jgi:hypothetical protein